MAEKNTIQPLVPKDFLLGPVFAAKKQAGPRTVVLTGRGLEYTIGGFHPLRPELKPAALDIRHARAVFAILTFRDLFKSTPSFSFSMNELCKRYANSNGGRYSREIKAILADLVDAFFKVKDIETGEYHIYRIIERIDVHGKAIRRKDHHLASNSQMEMWFNGVTLSPEFYKILQDITELQHLKLEVMTEMTSNLAQAIYLYIPSRAHHHTKAAPFKISLTNLLGQVGANIPRKKSERRKIFTQNRTSILQQLDGAETLAGKFRVKIELNKEGSDFNLLAWLEKPNSKTPKLADSRLIQAFIKGGGGRPRAKAQKLIRERTALDYYELELLERGGIKVEGNEVFFEMSKALLGIPRFRTLLSEAKADSLEGSPTTKGKNERLGYRIIQALES